MSRTKNEILQDIKQTHETIRKFLEDKQNKRLLNHRVVGQVFKEFSEALIYLLEKDNEE